MLKSILTMNNKTMNAKLLVYVHSMIVLSTLLANKSDITLMPDAVRSDHFREP